MKGKQAEFDRFWLQRAHSRPYKDMNFLLLSEVLDHDGSVVASTHPGHLARQACVQLAESQDFAPVTAGLIFAAEKGTLFSCTTCQRPGVSKLLVSTRVHQFLASVCCEKSVRGTCWEQSDVTLNFLDEQHGPVDRLFGLR